MAELLMMSPSDVVVRDVRHELDQLEDEAAATGWAWDATLSRRVDALCVQIEARPA